MTTPPAWKGVFYPALRESDLPLSNVYTVHAGSAHHDEGHNHDGVDGAGALTNDVHDGYLEIVEIAEPGNAPANRVRLYVVDQNGYAVLEAKGETGLTRRLARDNYFIAKVKEAGGVVPGDAVYISGATGANEEVKKAKADALATMPAIGLSLDTGALNDFVRVMVVGKVSGLNTNGFSADGVLLYVSEATAGLLTETPPAFPNISQRIGVLTRKHLSNGEILVLTTRLLEQVSHADLSDVTADQHHAQLHQAAHNNAGGDALKLDDLATPDDNTDLNASTLRHGLMQKYPGGTTNFLREDGTFASPAAGATNIKETEVDWGTAAYQTDKTFTIVDGDVGAGSQLMAQVAHKSPSDGRSVDEIAAETFDLKCKVAAGSFDLTMRSLHGSVTGRFLINYLVG